VSVFEEEVEFGDDEADFVDVFEVVADPGGVFVADVVVGESLIAKHNHTIITNMSDTSSHRLIHSSNHLLFIPLCSMQLLPLRNRICQVLFLQFHFFIS